VEGSSTTPGRGWQVRSYAAISIVAFVLLATLHGYLPLWIEGLTEYQTALSVLLGFRTDPQPCMLVIGGSQIPLAVAPYVGAGFIYLNAPFVAAWYHGWVDDPYVYRFVGILAFIGIGWLLFFLCARFWGARTGWWCAVLWTTTPYLAFVALADLQWEFIPIFFALLAVALFRLYLDRNRWPFFVMGCLVSGVVVVTRVDVFLLSAIGLGAYLLLFRPEIVRKPLFAALPRSAAAAGVALFLAGMSPFILYQFVCPSGRVSGFLSGSVLTLTFGAEAAPFAARMALRAQQYFSVSVLHQLAFLDLTVSNYVHVAAWCVAVAVLIANAIMKRGLAFPAFAIALLLPVSLISTGVLRPEHMINFAPLTAMLVSRGLTGMSSSSDGGRFARARIRAGSILLVVTVIANLVVSGLNWRSWAAHPATRDFITNQSAPVVLAEYLAPFHGSRILFTNVGLWNYVQYMTAARLKSENIVSWNGPDEFRAFVEDALRDRNRLRLFVGASLERDGGRFTLARTALLHQILDEHRVPYERVIISTNRRKDLYEVTFVRPGRGI
jgi:hypothetical protein